jgi:protein-tyrosine-phosphatase
MERRVVPEWAEVAVSALLERCSRVAPFGFLRNYAKTHLALVRPLPVLESAGVTPAATPSVVPGATPALTRARTARTIAGDIRRLPERVLHARRHRRVLSVVRRNSGEGPVLVLCQGNICRSPYAAAVLSSLVAAHGTRVHSAGFIGPGRPVPDHALRLAGDRGIDLAQHRSRLVTEGLIESAQLVVVMDEDQARAVRVRHPAMRAPVLLLGDFDPSPISRRSIHDPWAQPAHVFAHVFARLDRCTQTLAGALTTREA